MNSAIEDLKSIPAYIKPLKEKKIHAGGNSSVYEWENEDGSYIVKKFSGANSNIAERFEREESSLILLEQNGIENVPRLLYSDFDSRIIITNKLPGNKPVKLTLDIFMQYYKISKLLQKKCISVPSKLIVKNASDSLLEPMRLVTKIKKEFDAIKMLIDCESNTSNDFYLEATNIINQKEKSLQITKKMRPVLDRHKIFSFSDLGPRNMLLDNTKVYFLDFEHAGWDDPIKGIIDLLICPTNEITAEDSKKIVQFVINNNQENGFAENFLSWLPILSIKWIIIYIKYNLKLHKKTSIKLKEVQSIYLKGRHTRKQIENVIKNN